MNNSSVICCLNPRLPPGRAKPLNKISLLAVGLHKSHTARCPPKSVNRKPPPSHICPYCPCFPVRTLFPERPDCGWDEGLKTGISAHKPGTPPEISPCPTPLDITIIPRFLPFSIVITIILAFNVFLYRAITIRIESR